MNFPLSVYFTKSQLNPMEFNKSKAASLYPGILPPNVHLLSLNALSNGTADQNAVIFRFTHLFAVDEDLELSQPVEIDLSAFIGQFTIQSISEMTLSATQVIQENVPSTFTIYPKEIRTFKIIATNQ